MEEDIIGYLLGALEEDEMAQFEAELDRNPDLQARVQDAARSLHLFDYDREDVSPPPGLLEKTCGIVSDSRSAAQANVPSFTRDTRFDGSSFKDPNESWTMLDVMIAASVMLVACMLLFPAINNSRLHAEIAGCQDNLRRLGVALIEYSMHDPHCAFPEIPASGNLSVAGFYAPALLDSGFVTEQHAFFCPSASNHDTRVMKIPTLKEVMAARGDKLEQLQHRMGGHYGYTLGFLDGKELRGFQNLGRSHFAIMSDAPVCESMPPKHQLTHRNVMFECGGVRVIPLNRPSWNGDPLFENDNGEAMAGCHERDIVIGFSAACPVR